MVLGFCFYHGVFFKKDKEKAIQWITSASMLGYPAANLWLYSHKNPKTQPNLLRSLRSDYGNAFTALAKKFSFTNDRSIEFYFSMAAAQKGSPYGKFLVGNRYKNGEGIRQSFDKAAEWYKIAFEDQYLMAKIHLDEIYDKTTKFKKKYPDFNKHFLTA